MAKAIRIATINHNDQEGVRVRLELHKDKDAYRWYTGTGEDTEVSGKTVAKACEAAHASWNYCQSPWGFRARW